MSDPPSPLPFRLISRISNEMHLSGMILVGQALPHNFDRSIVILVLMRVCQPDWTGTGTLRRPARLTRFASVNSIATSLGRSPETIRRHIHALIDSGICVRGDEGVALSPDPAPSRDPVMSPDLLRLYTDYHDLMVGFAADLAAWTPPAIGARASGEAMLPAVIATALDIALIPFERFGHLLTDWTSLRVWGCIGALNVRHIMLDPVLTQRYAVASTPNGLRRPVSLRTVERTLDIPYATAWRHCRVLETQGMLSQCEDGWLVRVEQLRDAAMEEAVVATVHYYLRRIAALVGHGFDPAHADAAYLHGRVPLAPER